MGAVQEPTAMPTPGATFVRQEIEFPAGADRCAAWLYRPESGASGAAAVMAHGFCGTRDAGLEPFAEAFATAGLTVLLFDHRHFGASGGHPRQLLSIRRQLADWRAAVAFARGRPEVDPARVALWGTSFSAGHAITTAAADPRVAAVVAMVPFLSGLATVAAVRPFPVQPLRLVAAGLADLACAAAGRPPLYLPAVGPPRSRAMMTAPEAEPGYRAIAPADWDERVAARVALVLPAYSPGRRVARMRCPLFLGVADADETTPPQVVDRVARRARQVELRRYPTGHFGVYQEPLHSQVVADQLAFLRRHLGLA